MIGRRFGVLALIVGTLSVTALAPRSRSLSTGSFISAISGETTIVVPGRCSAGSW